MSVIDLELEVKRDGIVADIGFRLEALEKLSDESPTATQARAQMIRLLGEVNSKIEDSRTDSKRIEEKVDANTCALAKLAPVIERVRKKKELSKALKVIGGRIKPAKYYITLAVTSVFGISQADFAKISGWLGL